MLHINPGEIKSDLTCQFTNRQIIQRDYQTLAYFTGFDAGHKFVVIADAHVAILFCNVINKLLNSCSAY
jgi:hypothetical protein